MYNFPCFQNIILSQLRHLECSILSVQSHSVLFQVVFIPIECSILSVQSHKVFYSQCLVPQSSILSVQSHRVLFSVFSPIEYSILSVQSHRVFYSQCLVPQSVLILALVFIECFIYSTWFRICINLTFERLLDNPELKTLEWWISGLRLNPLFFLISRLDIAWKTHDFNLQINYSTGYLDISF